MEPWCHRACAQDTVTLLAREKDRLELEEQNQLKEEQRLQRVAALVQVGARAHDCSNTAVWLGFKLLCLSGC